MAEEQVIPPAGFGIVLLGAMNPRLHHPLWYKLIGLIDEAEAAEAMAGSLIVTPQISQFQTSKLQLTATSERWELHTQDPELRDRVAKMAATTFDEKLHETPISLFAFNNNFYLKAAGNDIAKSMASKLEKSLGLSFPNLQATSTMFVLTGDGGPINIRIEPSTRGSDEIFVAVNSNHAVTSSSGYFKLSEVFGQTLNTDCELARKYAKEIVDVFSKSERE
jgi:hypothetical protein